MTPNEMLVALADFGLTTENVHTFDGKRLKMEARYVAIADEPWSPASAVSTLIGLRDDAQAFADACAELMPRAVQDVYEEPTTDTTEAE